MSQDQMRGIENLTDAFEVCQIKEKQHLNIVLNDTCNSFLLGKFPKPKSIVPPKFLHKPINFAPLMRKVLNLGIKFYQPCIGNHYTKICCQTFNDHKALIQYFKNKHLPYHTYGHPNKRKMKVVFKGLPKDVDLDLLKKELQLASIPIARIHKMKNHENLPLFVLIVVPNDDEGRKILKVQQISGHNIKIEPLKPKTLQCHRCQKWGHAQRYCNGHMKCVKCGGDHITRKCTRDPSKEPPKCANCGSDHTSNYKLCPFSPNSPQYENNLLASVMSTAMLPSICVPRKLVTAHNCHLIIRGMI